MGPKLEVPLGLAGVASELEVTLKPTGLGSDQLGIPSAFSEGGPELEESLGPGKVASELEEQLELTVILSKIEILLESSEVGPKLVVPLGLV